MEIESSDKHSARFSSSKYPRPEQLGVRCYTAASIPLFYNFSFLADLPGETLKLLEENISEKVFQA